MDGTNTNWLDRSHLEWLNSPAGRPYGPEPGIAQVRREVIATLAVAVFAITAILVLDALNLYYFAAEPITWIGG